MSLSCVDFDGTICKHVDDTLVRYADFGPMLNAGETIASATVTCAEDTALTISSVTVLSSNTVVPTKSGTRTITANEGISFGLAAGTAITESDEPVRLKISATLSTGKIAVRTARLRVSD
jgi:hypothetical protein